VRTVAIGETNACGTRGGEEFSIKQRRKRPCIEFEAEAQLTSEQVSTRREINIDSQRPCTDPASNEQAAIKRKIKNKPTNTELAGEEATIGEISTYYIGSGE
jgi:hypothetical protein